MWNGSIPFKFGRGSAPHISHICFADDLILVAEATMNQVQVIKGILQGFCDVSGQKVSLGRSQVFFLAMFTLHRPRSLAICARDSDYHGRWNLSGDPPCSTKGCLRSLTKVSSTRCERSCWVGKFNLSRSL